MTVNPYRTARIERGGFRAQVTPEVPAGFLAALGSGYGAETRNLASLLLVDIVGSSSASTGAESEGQARLERYREFLRRAIEGRGGEIETFAGDSLVAVFRASAGVEHVAEHAVRTALAVLDAATGTGVDARAALHTYEIGAPSGEGERRDIAVERNAFAVAARLVDVAPEDGLVVDDETYWATQSAVEYVPLRPIPLDERGELLPIRLAVGIRRDDKAPHPRSMEPISREAELTSMEDVFAQALRESTAQLLTIVGPAGVGKSWLVSELRRRIRDRFGLVHWLEGRCRPYGNRTKFAPVADIVKAYAGIVATDDPESAHAKLRHAVAAALESDAPREHIELELHRLVEPLDNAADSPPRDSFAAWRAFLEAIATQRPLVILFEDMHWADAQLLEFVEYLTDETRHAPLLVVCVARPELYEFHPRWGEQRTNASMLSVPSLTREEVAHLLLGRTSLRAETPTE